MSSNSSLTPDDVAAIHRIAATPIIMKAMDDAWAQSDKDGKERGFFIYVDGGRYFTGPTVTGSDRDLGPLWGVVFTRTP